MTPTDLEPSDDPCFAVRPWPIDRIEDRPDHILCHRPKGHDGNHGNHLYEWE